MMWANGAGALVLAAVLVGGCATAGTYGNRMTDDGFVASSNAYLVRAVAKAPPVSDGKWRISNFTSTEPRKSADIEPTSEYVLYTRPNNTGPIRVELPQRDLAFASQTDEGQFWLRSVPLTLELQTKGPGIYLEKLVEGMNSATTTTRSVAWRTWWGGEEGVSIGKTETVSARIVETQAATIAGIEAVRVTIDVAYAEQARLDAGQVDRRVAMWMVILPKVLDRENTLRHALVITASNVPQRFEQTLVAAESLLPSIESLQ